MEGITLRFIDGTSFVIEYMSNIFKNRLKNNKCGNEIIPSFFLRKTYRYGLSMGNCSIIKGTSNRWYFPLVNLNRNIVDGFDKKRTFSVFSFLRTTFTYKYAYTRLI